MVKKKQAMCEGCSKAPSQANAAWYYGEDKHLRLCTRCAEKVAKSFKGFVRKLCRVND